MSTKVTTRRLRSLGRKELIALHKRNRAMYHEWIRRLVLQGGRVDLLAEVVLGYQICPHHARMLVHQHKHLWSQTLVWRGSGKTTVLTVAESIWHVLRNPDVRILFASKTGTNAEDFLKEVKMHFEANERLREIFGDFVGDRWDAQSIEVRGRTQPFKEPTINTVGVSGAVASKHYDIINADDLVDEDNSRTKYQREKMLDWFYKMLLPCLNPPTPDDPFVGSLNVIGTRYHYEDLHGHFLEVQPDQTGGEMAGSTLVIPVEDEEGNPVWPEKYTKEQIKKLRSMGIIRFNSQYKCDCDAMKGQIFRYDDCRVVKDDEIPPGLRVFMGVDLAISESESADMFAIVVIGRDAQGAIYVLEYLEAQLRFPQQTRAIIDFARRYKPIRIGLEVNAYQRAQLHQVKAEAPDLNVLPITTLKDKVTRAWNLAKHFENNKMRFRMDQQPMIEHLVLFPGHRYKDIFDALDLAVQASEVRVRKRRAEEPGVL